MKHDIVVIGASAGGVEAVSYLIGQIPSNFPGSIFVVIHTAADGPGLLAGVLQRSSVLPVQTAEDGMSIRRGRVYVSAPNRHLVVENGRTRLIRGPLENRHRPAIDALFRSAAKAYRERVAAVVLTGYLDDGAAGLLSVRRNGGIA